MADAVEYILDGLEAALGLERELGVRTVEIDRGLLVESVGRDDKTVGVGRVDRPAAVNRPIAQSVSRTIPDIIFLHDRPLSPGGVEMMAKILNALERPDAPIMIAPPLPRARVIVVLGGLALKKFFPGLRGEPGQWIRQPNGTDVLITYSPEYILRFGTMMPAMQKLKQNMWRGLKAAISRLR